MEVADFFVNKHVDELILNTEVRVCVLVVLFSSEHLI